MIHFIPRLSHPLPRGARPRGLARLHGLATLAAVLTIALTARLGWWQLDRAAQKEALLAAIQARSVMAPLGSDALLQLLNSARTAEPGAPAAAASTAVVSTAAASTAAAELHHRPAVLTGHWRPDHLLFLENRPMNGRPGFIALMPLVLPDGRAILVQRGWQPRDLRDRTLTRPVPAPQDRMVRVRGRLAPPPSRLMDFDGAAAGPVRQNVELQQLAAETGLGFLPVTLLQLESALVCSGADGGACDEVIDDGLLRDWPVVGSSSDKNRGYAVQWFSLSALVLALLLWFQFIQPRRRARLAQ